MKIIKLIMFVLLAANSMFAQIPSEEGFGNHSPEIMEPYTRGAGVYYKDGKSGIRNYDGTDITEPIFDKSYLNSSLGIIVKKDNKFGFYNRKGVKIISLKFDSISPFGRQYLKVKKNNKYGVYNGKGEKIVPIKFNEIITSNYLGMFVVKDKHNEINIIGKKGKVIISSIKSVSLYNNGAVVGNGDKYGFLTADFKTDFIYDSIPVGSYKLRKSGKTYRGYKRRLIQNTSYTLFRIVVVKDGKVGMVDSSNNVLIPIDQDEVIDMKYKGYYTVKKGDKLGYFLKRCDIYKAPIYDRLYMDGSDYLNVYLGRNVGVVDDANGKMIIPVEYHRIMKTKNSFTTTKDNKKGVIDMKGKMILPASYDKIENLTRHFSKGFEGYYKVTIDKKSGIVDTNNTIIIPIEYDYLYDFEDKFFIVKKDTLFGLFAKNGDLIHGLKFDYIERGRNDKCVVYLTHKDGLVGVINNKGEEIYTPQFKKVSKVPDGDLDIRFVERYEKNYYLVFTSQYGKSGLFNLYTGKFDLELEYDNICQQLNKRYFSAKKNGKFGVVSYENKVLIDFIYDTISFYHTFVIDEEEMEEAGFVASLNGAYGALNLKNKTLIPFIYKELKKLGYNNVYKAKKNSNYVLVDQNNTVLNKDPFDDIADYEQFLQRDGRNYYYKTLSFNNGKMREMDGKGKFLTNSINMSPHEGFTSFLELKLELIKALNNESDSALYYYGKKIAPSPHLVSLIDKSAKRLYENSQYLNYDDIYSRYFYKLLEFKRYYWNGSYFDKDNLMTEDFTIRKKGIVTNKRLKDYAYGDSHYLEKILRNAIKINGYWISSYYLSRYY